MAKKVLLIENDPAFAGELSTSLENVGFDVRATGDGKEGIEQARDWAPDAIVLCVELPGMSGYLVCQKIRKDEALKGIPLVLTSAEATEETFEKHRTLKARADEYLLKPYAPGALVELLDRLVGLPEGVEIEAGDEELVTLVEEAGLEQEVGDADLAEDTGLAGLQEEAGLEAAEGEPDREIPGLDLQSLPDDLGAPARGGEEDEDLRLLDDAFDGLSAPPAADDAEAALDELDVDRPVPGEDVDAAVASLPEEDEGAGRAELEALEEEAEDVLGALDDGAPAADLDEPPPARVRGASADLLRAAGVTLLDGGPGAREPARGDPGSADRLEAALAEARDALDQARADLAARDRELRDLRLEVDGASRRAEEAGAEAARARSEVSAAAAQARKAEGEARDARRAAEDELAEGRRKLAEAERRAAAAEEEARRNAKGTAAAAEAVAKVEALERENDELRTELLVARGEADGARGEVEKRTLELRKRLADVETQGAKNEERVVKAYQKIKADEKIREKVRKALTIALQLIDEGLPAESPAEKERRAASLAGRE